MAHGRGACRHSMNGSAVARHLPLGHATYGCVVCQKRKASPQSSPWAAAASGCCESAAASSSEEKRWWSAK